MDIKLLKASILSNSIPKFLVFIDTNPALCKHYITNISKTLGLDFKYYDSIDSVIYQVSSNIKDSDYVYIVYNDQLVLNNPNYIETIKSLNKTIILVYPEINKTSALYKQFSKNFVIFEKLDSYTIVAYMQKQLNDNNIEIAQDKLFTLVDYCNCDLGLCLNELDKIITLAQENSNVLCEYMLNNGFSDYRHTNVHKFVDNILNSNLSAYEDRNSLEESCITVLMILYNKAKYRYLSSRNVRYLNIMKLSYDLYTRILDGTIDSSYAIGYLLSVFVK